MNEKEKKNKNQIPRVNGKGLSIPSTPSVNVMVVCVFALMANFSLSSILIGFGPFLVLGIV